MSSCISFFVVVNCMHSNHINLKVFGHRKFFQQQNSEFYIWLCGKGVLKILPLIIQGFYYHNPSSRAHYFMKSFIFLVGTTIWGVQDPHELIRYCSPIYVLCVSSRFWQFTKLARQIWFWKFSTKTWASVSPPPPLVGPNAQLYPKKKIWRLPLSFLKIP